VKQLIKSGIRIGDTYCVLQKQAKGSPYLGYDLRDVYNKLHSLKIEDLMV